MFKSRFPAASVDMWYYGIPSCTTDCILHCFLLYHSGGLCMCIIPSCRITPRSVISISPIVYSHTHKNTNTHSHSQADRGGTAALQQHVFLILHTGSTCFYLPSSSPFSFLAPLHTLHFNTQVSIPATFITKQVWIQLLLQSICLLCLGYRY